MGPMPPALFVPEPDCVRATELTRGPWAHQVMHGGAICGLLGWAVEREQQQLGIDQVCSRLTTEILSGMPMATYEVTATIVKAGKRTALVDAEVRAAPPENAAPGSGRVVARATSQWLTPTIATPAVAVLPTVVRRCRRFRLSGPIPDRTPTSTTRARASTPTLLTCDSSAAPPKSRVRVERGCVSIIG